MKSFASEKITTIIFDLDGTLVDSLPDIADAMNRVLAHHQQPIHSHEAYRALIGNGIRSMVNRLVPHYESAHQQVLYDEFVGRYSEHLFDKSTCYPGILELVARLRFGGYELAVFSNKRHDLTKKLVAHFFRPSDFKVVKGHIEGQPRKPDPIPTNELLSDLVVEPANAILIGDTAIDVETAGAVNMRCLGVGWGYRPAQTLVDAGARTVVDSAEQIMQWIERHNAPDELNAGNGA